ncbi:10413_t:CDS:2, partial [Paraglomus brasilianum]
MLNFQLWNKREKFTSQMTVIGRAIGQALEYQLKLRPIQCCRTMLFAELVADKPYSAISTKVLMRSYQRSSVIQKSNDGKSLIVHIDGCAINNGQPDARAGIGVFWGEDDPRFLNKLLFVLAVLVNDSMINLNIVPTLDDRNLNEPLEDGRQTNQRAEIMAAIRALETCNDTKSALLVCTDSIYLKKAYQKWITKWEANEEKNENGGWKTSNNKPVANEDLFRRLIALIRSREGVVNIKWVKAHHKSKANIAADKLANLGASKSSNTATASAAAKLDSIVKKPKRQAVNCEKKDQDKIYLLLSSLSNASSIANAGSPSINANGSSLTKKTDGSVNMMMHEAQEVGKVATDQEMWVLSPMGECLTFISSFPKILSGLCQFKKNLLSNYDIQVYGFISIYQTLLAAVHYGWNQESQIISHLSESSGDLYSCLLVNQMWSECAVVHLWHTPFYWSGHKAGAMVKSFLQLLPSDCFEDLEYLMGIHMPPRNTQPTFSYLSFIRTMKIIYCINAVEFYLDIVNAMIGLDSFSETDTRLLLLRLCKGIVANCPSLREIDLTGLSFDDKFHSYKWTAKSWNFFNVGGIKPNLGQLKRLDYSQEFHPDILHSAAECLTSLEFFKFDWSYYTSCVNDAIWCDAVGKLICNQRNLKAVQLNLDFKPQEISLQQIGSALSTQARSLERVEIPYANSDIYYIINACALCTNLYYVELSNCMLCPQSPLQLASDAFSNLGILKLETVSTNDYGIYALLGNVKSCLEILSVKRVKGICFDINLWKECAICTPSLTDLDIILEPGETVLLLQNVLPLWQHLNRLSICIWRIYSCYQGYELLSKSLSLLGSNLPSTVKFLKLDIFYQLPWSAFNTFLSTCSAKLESFYILIDDINDDFVKNLLEHMGDSLKSIYLE